MSHPYHHAVARARTWGGVPGDYEPIESWFDHTKAFTPDARHRLLLHNSYGVFLAERRFGVTITNSDGRAIPVRIIGESHCKEDFNRAVPSLTECLSGGLSGALEGPQGALRDAYLRAFDQDDDVHAHCEHSAALFGGDPATYEALHAFLNESRDHLACPQNLLATHHTFGVHLATQLFGQTLGGVSVRRLAEAHVLRDMGQVPAVDDALKLIPLEPWMSTRALPLERLNRSPQVPEAP